MAGTGSVGRVHPIERLRAVARAPDVDQSLLACEAAAVLASFGDDPRGLVIACRRLTDRHPAAGSLWWACARLLAAEDVAPAAREVRDELVGDPTVAVLALDVPEGAAVAVVPDVAGGSELADELGRRRGDLSLAHHPRALHVGDDRPRLLLVEAAAAGPDGFLAADGTAEEVAAAREAGVAAWLVVGVGRRLPAALFDVATARASATGVPGATGRSSPPVEVVGVAATGRVVEPRRLDCPVPPELLRAPGGW